MKKRLRLSWVIYSLMAVGLFFAIYFWFNQDKIICAYPPRNIDSMRKDSCFRDSIVKVESAAVAEEYARRKADTQKQKKLELSDTLKNANQNR